MRIRPYITQEKKIGGAVLSFSDITEMKVWEAQRRFHTENLELQVTEQSGKLLQNERLTAIGKTAGMVGHDVRNPLQSMIGEIYLMNLEVAKLPEGEEKKSMLESILSLNQNITYINKIVADLQDFAKAPIPQLEEVYIEKAINEVIHTSHIPKEVAVSIFVEKDFPKLKLDASYLKRTLTNLVSNAVQAMPKGGKLTVNAFSQDDKVVIHVSRILARVCLQKLDPKFSRPYSNKIQRTRLWLGYGEEIDGNNGRNHNFWS